MECFIGTILPWAGAYLPRNWAPCFGQILAVSDYQSLYSVIGDTYGGNGRTTFALPDLRGRVAIGQGTGPGLSPHLLGERGGRENVTLTEDNMPPHSHKGSFKMPSLSLESQVDVKGDLHLKVDGDIKIAVQDSAGENGSPGNQFLAGAPYNMYDTEPTPDAYLNSEAVEVKLNASQSVQDQVTVTTEIPEMWTAATVSSAGRSVAVWNMQPFQVIEYIIAMDGILPPRP